MKKRKKEDLKISSGVGFYRDVSFIFAEKEKYNWKYLLLQYMTVLILVLSTCFCFISGFEVEILSKSFFIAILIVAAIFCFTFSLPKGMEIFMAIEWLFYGVGGFWFRKEISNGLAVVSNFILEKVMDYYNVTIFEFQQAESNTVHDATIFLIFVMIFIAGMISYIVVNRVPWIVTMILTLPIALCCLFVGYMPEDLPFIAYILIIIALAGSRSEFRKGIIKGSQVQKYIHGKIILILLLLGGVIISLACVFYPRDTYEEQFDKKELKKEIQETVRKEAERLFKGELLRQTAAGGLSNGKLGKVSGIEYNGETRLVVSVPKEQKSTFYLRSFVGNVYDNNRWKYLNHTEEQKKKTIATKSGISFENLGSHWFTLFKDYPFTSSLDDILALQLEEQLSQDNISSSMLSSYDSGTSIIQESSLPENIVSDLKKIKKRDMKIVNKSESRNNLFLPNGLDNEVYEAEGKLRTKVKNKGDYVLSYYPQLFQIINYEVLGNAWNWGININIPTNFLRKNADTKKVLETYLGKSLSEYEKKENEGKTIAQFLEEKGTVQEAVWSVPSAEGTAYLYLKDDMLLNDAVDIINAVDKYEEAEKAYRSLAYEVYMQVPEDVSLKLEDILTEDFMKGSFDTNQNIKEDFTLVSQKNTSLYVNDNSIESISRKLYMVKEYLKTHTKYDLSPGKLPAGKDFVEYFLFESKKGYCSHYASTGVLLLRMLGVPARYVEGYVVMEADIEKGRKENDFITMEIPDGNAHAWVEIYLDGFGWMPVEMTPGYMEEIDGQYPFGESKTSGEEKTTPKPANKASQKPNTPSPSAKASPNTGKTGKDSADLSISVFYKILFSILGIVVLLGIAIAFILIRKKWKEKALYDSKYSNHKNVQAVYYYHCLESILKCKKYMDKEEDLRELLGSEKIVLDWGEEKQWKEFVTIMNQAFFSNAEISTEELGEIITLYDIIRENIYKNSSKIQKIYYKYIKIV